ncbi:hypothetical protein GBA52_010237 [Prunus armeniaca]|nr:hypothetical protein GBA52_010237 [Prunus armeniaca]
MGSLALGPKHQQAEAQPQRQPDHNEPLNHVTRRAPDMDSDKEMSAPVIEGNDAVTGHIISTTIGGKNGEPKRTISYMAERVVGTGSFGIVFQAKCIETGETVAIKKVLQDRRYKNRELQLMRLMDHPNVVSLKHCFFSTTSKDELFLNLVMEYVPETMYRVLKHYSSMNQRMPLIYVKLYTYQIFRGLAYIHAVPGVCHRDVKPQNLLVDPLTHQVKLCDFGSAKVLVKGEANISYICSRYYRAPELIFGATEYTTSIDIWSAGCVLAELLLGQPLFPGENAVDQLVEIIKVLGTPTREEIRCMNPNYTDFRFPQIKAHPWHKVFHKRMPPEAIDLASRLLQYSPSLRCTALEACTHPFFDELREPNARLPNGRPLPPLFNFKQELSGASPELINRLIPEYMRQQTGLGFPHPVESISKKEEEVHKMIQECLDLRKRNLYREEVVPWIVARTNSIASEKKSDPFHFEPVEASTKQKKEENPISILPAFPSFALCLAFNRFTFLTVANRYAAQLQLCCPQSPVSYSIARTTHAHMITSGFKPRGHILNRLIDVYCKSSNFSYAHQLFDQIPKPDIVARTTLITAYSAIGNLTLARKIFNETPLSMRDTVCYNAMITGYSRNNDGYASIRLFCEMRRGGFRPDDFTYTTVLSGAAQIVDVEKQCQQLHCAVVKSGTGFATSVWNALLSVYVRCASSPLVSSSSLMGEARNLFNEMPERDELSWTTMITGYIRNEDLHAARELLDGMDERMEVVWNAMISGYAHHNSFQEALLLFRKMRLLGIRQDEFTYTSVISTCANNGLFQLGKQVHAYILRTEVKPTVDFSLSVNNTLLTLYYKCGKLDEARYIFNNMPVKDLVSWNAILSGVKREANICSRRYQASELIFGVKNIQHPLISGQLVVSLLSFFWARLSTALDYCWPKLTWVKEYLLFD